jgi:predicted nuclease of predicted toxin-antitoxin system
MNLVADEGVDWQIVDRLRRDGHAVVYVAELERSLPDDRVLSHANEIDALLLTADKDFGDLVFRQNRLSAGVVLLRLAGLSPESKASRVADALRDHGGEMRHAFSVISPGIVRIRASILGS